MGELIVWLLVALGAQSLLIVVFYSLWNKNMRLLMDITHMNLRLAEMLLKESK